MNEYDNLPDVTLFSQCKTSDHAHILRLQTYISTESFCSFIEYMGRGFANATCGDEHSDTGEVALSSSAWGCIDWPEGKWQSSFASGQIKKVPYDIHQFYVKFIDARFPEKDKCVTLFAGTFSATRDVIRSRPREYYARLLDLVSNHSQPEEIHYIERLEAYVFLPVDILNQCRSGKPSDI